MRYQYTSGKTEINSSINNKPSISIFKQNSSYELYVEIDHLDCFFFILSDSYAYQITDIRSNLKELEKEIKKHPLIQYLNWIRGILYKTPVTVLNNHLRVTTK